MNSSVYPRRLAAVCIASLVPLLTLATGCAAGGKTAAGECPANEVAVAGGCALPCSSNSHCFTGEICGPSGTCEAAAADVLAQIPVITSINGNGSADGRPGHTDNHLATGVLLTGSNLLHTAPGFSVALLDDLGTATDLTGMILSSASDSLSLALPTALAHNTNYTIRVANQFGSDQTTVLVLQGEAGTAGAAGMNAICEANCGESTPNTPRQTTIELRAVNPVNPVVKAFIRIDTGGATTLHNFEPTSSGAGILVALVDMNSTDTGAHTIPAAPANPTPFFTQYDALVDFLDSVMPGTLVSVATYGDIAALQSTTRTLSDLLTSLEALGAPPEIRNVTATEGFVFVGHRRVGRGNGAFARMSDADAAWDLDEDPSTTGDMGRAVWTRQWLANNQLVGVHSRPSGVFSQAVVANAGVTANSGMVISTAGALQVGSTADVVDLGGDTLSAGGITGTSLTVGSGAITGGAITGGAITGSSLSLQNDTTASLLLGAAADPDEGSLTYDVAANTLTVTTGTQAGLVLGGTAATLPTDGSFYVGGNTASGVDGARLHYNSTAEQTFIDSKGTNTAINLRGDDVDGSTQTLAQFGVLGTTMRQHVRLGGGTQATHGNNLALGDIVLDNNSAAPPALAFLNGANSNWAIDVTADTLRIVQDLEEVGGVAHVVVNSLGELVAEETIHARKGVRLGPNGGGGTYLFSIGVGDGTSGDTACDSDPPTNNRAICITCNEGNGTAVLCSTAPGLKDCLCWGQQP